MVARGRSSLSKVRNYPSHSIAEFLPLELTSKWTRNGFIISISFREVALEKPLISSYSVKVDRALLTSFSMTLKV